MNDRNDQRALLAITLCLAVFTIWSYFFGPKPTPVEPTPTEVAGAPASGTAGAVAPVAGTPDPSAAASPASSAASVTEGPCVSSPTVVETSIADLSVDNCGAAIAQVHVTDTPAPLVVTPWWTWVYNSVMGAFSGGSAGGWSPYVETEGLVTLVKPGGSFATAGRGDFRPGGSWTSTTDGDVTVLRRVTSDGLSVTTTLTKTADPDLLDLAVRWEATQPLVGPFWIGLDDSFIDIASRYDGHARISSTIDGSYATVDAPSKVTDVQPVGGEVNWFGVSDRYFLAALIPEDPKWGALKYTPTTGGKVGAFLVSDAGSVEPGKPLEAKLSLYVGKKDPERLAAIGKSLDKAASLGFWGFFAKILLFVLHLYQSAVGNWGVSIILLTCTVRLSIYPLARSGFLSAKRMGALQPKVKELQEVHKDDKEALGRAQMKLFSDNGVNPLGGCLPMLGQMPVFFALLSALYVTPDLYHANFLYIQDLSAPDPYGLFPGLMTIGSVLLQRMTPMTGMDPNQQQMMKFMPLIFAFFMFGVPAGLSLYYVFNTYLVILQQWYNMRSWDKIQAANA